MEEMLVGIPIFQRTKFWFLMV